MKEAGALGLLTKDEAREIIDLHPLGGEEGSKIIQSLNNIDSFHIQLKRHINKNLTGVATVYLPLYLALYVFKHNWSISHNKQHPTSRHDAENILIDLLQCKGTAYRSEDIKGGNILDYVKPTTHYINNLQELTEEMRRKSNIMGFTFDENDRLLTFNKRKYFRNCGITKLKQICKNTI